MKKVGNWFAASWTTVAATVAMLAILSLLLFGRLGTLLPGLSEAELTQAASSRTVNAIIENPLGLPHKALQYATQRIDVSAFTIRAPSAAIGFVSAVCFFYVLRNWYSHRIAVLGTALYVTTPWFLHTVRHGGSTSVYLLLFCAVACAVWLENSRGSIYAILCSAALVIALFYIPGMIWFVVPALLWQIGRIGEALEGQNAALLTVLSLLMLCTLVPLGWALYQNPDLVRPYFGLSQSFAPAVDILKNIALVPYHLVIRGTANPEMWLGTLPLLSVLPSVMLVIGLYVHAVKRKLDRVLFFGLVIVLGAVLANLGGPVNLVLLLPFLFAISISGLSYTLQRWFTVFPRNPFAKMLGTIVVFAVIALSAFGGISHYFVAWPNTPQTKEVFTKQP